ncbi:NAD-dependent malic enzyme [Candidatus Kaiserbacteria bacterium CG10_big_fil_rev_8_21_14_0_10_49_17]|uniref:NAD-dependent malic enzyme n=1 Tax=Candidatus Kaiserbacteria bacterium CG10_big_fil_rev_8_21_14_0_10_49_17 TaxID=1974609 RepID=A0A2M6WEB2_9BACT|nr:MAG: NAD-dependent malic enzyme [Candidatus Kaiserbacteria bacterium CG10_big_fil_rev_8_21_14_0_10_49_17]
MKKSDTAKKNVAWQALLLHKKLGGKIRMVPATPIRNRSDLSLVYTPGVATVSRVIAKNPKLARMYTIKKRMVAVISDGSAVLGLGNIGALGALPVMEGKCALFKTFAGVDAIPLVLDLSTTVEAGTQAEIDAIVETVLRVAPAFGGINLEDIAAPKCFEIERRVIEALDIPVMHDDQHGTAVVVLSALINAFKVVGKKFSSARIVILGAGAAGSATARLLHAAGAKNIIVLDSKGIVDSRRPEAHKRELATFNTKRITGGLHEALKGADVLLGVSGPDLVKAADIRLMASRAIVLAMANPVPEIMPDEAKRGGAMIVGTGRSDFPNQINNSLAFPGIFRGALDHKVTKITQQMKIKAAHAIAALVKKPTPERIIPDMFDKRVAPVVAKAMAGKPAVAKVIR